MAAVPYEGHAAAVPSRFATEGEATRLLYERHQRKILSFCKHQLGNREEAEDATQITFMNAFRGIKQGTSPEFESAWLFKIAHNVCLTKQRNSYRRRLVEAPSDLELIEERVAAYEGDTDELFGLQSALRVIPEQQRRALLLREWQGLTYKEIADEMRLTQGAVETLLFRARRSLADALTTDPAEKRKRGRPRMASNAGSVIAVLKSLLIGGGVKVAATVATVAATSVVAATPTVRHDFLKAVGHDQASPAKPVSALGRGLHVPLSVATPARHGASLTPAVRHAATKAPLKTRVSTPTTLAPMVAAETQTSTPAERTASPTGQPAANDQSPSVPLPVPASAPVPVTRDLPPADPEATTVPALTPAQAPAPAPSTSAAPVQQVMPSTTPVPAPMTQTRIALAPSDQQPVPTGPTQTAITPVDTTPIVVAAPATQPTPTPTPTTTLQVVSSPATTTPTVTTAPAAVQPTPVQTTPTQSTFSTGSVSQVAAA